MSDKQTLETAHGEVQYETVTCDSCENDIAKSEAERFAIGGYKRKFCGEYEFDASETTLGWVCQYCNDSPASYPTQSKVNALAESFGRLPEPVGFFLSLALLVASVGIAAAGVGILT